MLPTEQYSGDAVPQTPWTPAVWQQGPDGLIAEARQCLWADQTDVTSALDGGDRAMGGSNAAPQNESDQLIDGSTPGDSPSGGHGTGSGKPTGRASHWNAMMREMRDTEPLAAWTSGAHDGSVNPPPAP
jgi:hypothetical protein